MVNKEFYGLSSNVPRAIATSNKISNFANVSFTNSDLFREFDLSIIKLTFFNLKVRNWFLISRLFWFLGLNGANEKYKQCLIRVDLAYQYLTKMRNEKGNIILVAHGLINKFLEKNLKKDNFSEMFRLKNGCFEVTIYEKYRK